MNLSQNEGAPIYRHDDAALNMVHTVEFWALVRISSTALLVAQPSFMGAGTAASPNKDQGIALCFPPLF